MRTFGLWMLVGAVLVAASGCVSPYDSSVHPVRLERIEKTSAYRAVDLDGDGRDELVREGQVPGGKQESVVIQSLSGRAAAQVHFAGRILPLQFADVTQNGALEVVVPVVHDDSLFYNIVSADGKKLRRFFAVSGEPRQEPGGTIRWDPRSAYVRLANVTESGAPELVSFFGTGFSRQPRGVWVHSYPEGREVGHQRIGALVRGDFYFGDVDEDSVPEWLFGSIATNNGAEAGGIRDNRSYLGSIEVTTAPRMAWVRTMGGMFSEVELRHGDLDGDGRPEFVALRVPREGRQMASPLHQIDPATGETLQQYVPEAILRSVHVGALGKEGRDRVVVRDANGTLRVLDAQFDVVDRRSFEETIRAVRVYDDVNGDGRDELVVRTEKGTLWLGSDLSILASTRRDGKWRVIRTGVDRPSRIAIVDGGTMTQFRVAENQWWWAVRYGPAAGLVLGVFVVVGGGVLGVRQYHRFRLQKAVYEHVSAQSAREWLLVHPSDGIRETSTGARRILGGTEETDLDRTELRERVPELADHLDALARLPAGPQTNEVSVDGQTLTVTCTPLEVARDGRPYWLVWIDSESAEAETYHAQGLMAQRVAHDLKNPLTSILLTLQRMQMAYHERAPELAGTLDDYTERIEDRIASLRRMTTNVLKFVGKEDLRRTPTDVSAFLDEVAETLEPNLPPDIEMRRQLADDLPAAAVDRDQMRSVMENLVTNAVEAMPEGGVLTLSTRLARDLYFDDDAPRDYVVVEVLDTGVGMTADEQSRLFDPGFSTRGDTGLGMALVQKTIDDHGGQIDVESEPDVGTSVTLYLPVDSDSTTSAS